MALNQFCGCFAMLNYTGYIFAESGSNLSPNMSAIIVGLIQIFGSYFSTALVERAGRKLLIGGSAIGTGLGLSVLGAYMQLKFLEYDVSAFQWIPLVMFSFVIFIANWGVLTLPFLVLSEIVPQKIKSFATAFCMVNLWTFAFLAIKYFSTLFEVLGMHGTMFLFASCCFAGAIFIFLCVPETKGKSFAEIARGLE
jgi:Sugar (and other) transporter